MAFSTEIVMIKYNTSSAMENEILQQNRAPWLLLAIFIHIIQWPVISPWESWK